MIIGSLMAVPLHGSRWIWSRRLRISARMLQKFNPPRRRPRARNRMNPNQAALNAVSKPAAMFDHEKLDVYQLELQFIAWVTPLLEEMAQATTGKTREVCDQLDRA